jgi:hypothetical protein
MGRGSGPQTRAGMPGAGPGAVGLRSIVYNSFNGRTLQGLGACRLLFLILWGCPAHGFDRSPSIPVRQARGNIAKWRGSGKGEPARGKGGRGKVVGGRMGSGLGQVGELGAGGVWNARGLLWEL